MADDVLPILMPNIEGNGDDSSSDSEREREGEDNANGQEEDQQEQQQQEDGDNERKKKKKEKDKKKKKDKDGKRNINFDQSLPASHTYLGSDHEEYSGRTVLDDESYVNLPLLTLPSVVLIPGQTLPLQLFQPQTISMMRHVIQKDRTFGLVTSRYLDTSGPTLANIGTTAEIFSVKEEDEHGIETMRIKAMGRQRFLILETRRQADGITIGKVRILPEWEMPSGLEGAELRCHRLSYVPEITSTTAMEVAACGGPAGDRQPLARSTKNKYRAADWTWFPPWVYRQYDCDVLMELVKRELYSWNDTLQENIMPNNPSDFSFWVAASLPLDDGLRLHLLSINSAVQRLRCELSIMQKCTIMCCRDCGSQIAEKKDVFSMSVAGPMAAYVNPGGYVHETLTVYQVTGITHHGRPSTEHSWFPGYAWTVAECRQCRHHLGWKFTPAKKKLKPEKFWGLCRASLLPGLRSDGGDSEETGWMPTM
ncbi:protein cereblon-like [Branchiostoma floridae x Branchiostoma belcheri]